MDANGYQMPVARITPACGLMHLQYDNGVPCAPGPPSARIACNPTQHSLISRNNRSEPVRVVMSAMTSATGSNGHRKSWENLAPDIHPAMCSGRPSDRFREKMGSPSISSSLAISRCSKKHTYTEVPSLWGSPGCSIDVNY